MPEPELSKFARNYGTAICLSPERAALPFDQLTPAEQQCVQRVGEGVEGRIEQRFGVGDAPQITRYTVTGTNGEDLGTLTYAEGVLSWCVPKTAPPNCGIIGHGQDGLQAALQVLHLLGLTATPTGS